jgi:hypothetical protein
VTFGLGPSRELRCELRAVALSKLRTRGSRTESANGGGSQSGGVKVTFPKFSTTNRIELDRTSEEKRLYLLSMVQNRFYQLCCVTPQTKFKMPFS